MANPITWRNVDGLDTSGVSNLMTLASQTMNKGFDTATTTVKDAITQRASDLKVSRDATLNTALANLNKLSTAEFNDNNIVGSIGLDINDAASRRAFEEQVNALRTAKREEDEAIAKEKQKEKLRPIAVDQALANVKNTGSQTAQNYASADNLKASANNLNASAASTEQQTSARSWEHGNKVAQLNFEQNNAGLLGELTHANPEYFTQDNYNKSTEGMSSADKLLFNSEWDKARTASITRGGTQFDAQAAVLNAKQKLVATEDDQAGRAVVDAEFGRGVSYEGIASVVALMANGPAKNAAFSRLNEIYKKDQAGSNYNYKLVQEEKATAATKMGKELAATVTNPEDAEAAIGKLFKPGTDEHNLATNAWASANNARADAKQAGTASMEASNKADAQKAVFKLKNDPGTSVTAAAIAASDNPAQKINDAVNDAPPSQQAELRAFWEKTVADQATNMANQFVESNADPIMKDMRDPDKNPYEVLNNSLNVIKSPAVKAEVQKILVERMKASGDTGVAVAAVVEGMTKEVTAALDAQVNKLKPDITNLVAQNLNGKVTDAEVKTAISVLAAGNPDLQEGLTVQFNKVRGQFNTLSTQDRQKLDQDLAAVDHNYASEVTTADTELNDTLKSHPVDAKAAPIADANQKQQNMANKLVKVKATEGEAWNDFEVSQVSEKINETFNNADFKQELSNNLSAFSKQVRDAVDSGRIPEATGKRILDTLNNDPAVKNAIHNIIINTVIQPGADGVLEFTTHGFTYGGNIRQVENALPAAVEAVGINVLNNEIQRQARIEHLQKLSALREKKDKDYVALGKSFQGNPQAKKK